MKINLAEKSSKTESTTTINEMTLSPDAKRMVFKMFTKGIYSNPIGTVVREITSNCFDTHAAAKTDKPVIVRKTYDKDADSYSISFIDFGEGISPSRMADTFGVYFESTKRDTNEEIGGWGIGGKSPLAYHRSTGLGEDEYDNSYFITTNYNGMKYFYSIFFKGGAPQYSVMHSEETKEANGTEVRVPMLQRDIPSFEGELVKQLYYFENIVFEGWSDNIQNEFQILRGKNFLHRGSEFSRMHVCLGRVYYPIDFGVLGLDSYDYQIPIAINVPIGDISVTTSREQLDYSESTIKYLKKKVEEVMGELKRLLSKQYSNITSLEDYFKAKDDFGTLYLTDTVNLELKSILKPTDIDYSKYKYNAFKTPSSKALFGLFFNTGTYGKRENQGWRSDGFNVFNKDWTGLKESNVFYRADTDVKMKRMKNAFLKEDNGRYYIVTKSTIQWSMSTISDMFNVHFDNLEAFQKSATFKMLIEMQEEYFTIIEKYTMNYEKVDIPEDFTVSYKLKSGMSTAIKNLTIPMKFANQYSKQRVKLSALAEFRGKIFYGVTDDSFELDKAEGLFSEVFDRNYVARYSRYGGKFEKKQSMMFVSVAKNNIKYFEMLKNTYPVGQFYHRVLHRKVDAIISGKRNADLVRKYRDISDFYKSKLFKESVSPKWGVIVDEVHTFIQTLGKTNHELGYYTNYLSKYVDLNNIKNTSEEKKIMKKLDKIVALETANQNMLKYINVPRGNGWNVVNTEMDNKVLPKLLKNTLSL